MSGRLITTLALLTVVLLVSGCHDEDETAASGGASRLNDVPWALTGGIDVPGWETVAPTATFSDGRVAGSTGCNRFTATYTLDGDALAIDDAATTRMACQAPADAVEQAFVAALRRVEKWTLADGALALTDAAGDEVLRFAVPALAGDWVATMTYQGNALSSPIAGTEITASFADGKLTGSAGCNTYSASYRAERGTLTIEPPVATEKACPDPAGVMEQEQTYLASLALATSYRIEGETLSLLTADDTFVASYQRKR
jgi:heat shock protein HslJ